MFPEPPLLLKAILIGENLHLSASLSYDATSPEGVPFVLVYSPFVVDPLCNKEGITLIEPALFPAIFTLTVALSVDDTPFGYEIEPVFNDDVIFAPLVEVNRPPLTTISPLTSSFASERLELKPACVSSVLSKTYRFLLAAIVILAPESTVTELPFDKITFSLMLVVPLLTFITKL